MEYLGTGWMLFGGRSQESNLPGTAGGPQLDLKSSRLTGDDDLPRLDCYMEAGRIIATSLSFYIPQISFFRLIHAAYYHESIIVHIKPIFYNDI